MMYKMLKISVQFVDVGQLVKSEIHINNWKEHGEKKDGGNQQ